MNTRVIIGCFTFLVRKSLLVFREGGQSNTKVKQNNNTKYLFLKADFPLVVFFVKSDLEGHF